MAKQAKQTKIWTQDEVEQIDWDSFDYEAAGVNWEEIGLPAPGEYVPRPWFGEMNIRMRATAGGGYVMWFTGQPLDGSDPVSRNIASWKEPVGTNAFDGFRKAIAQLQLMGSKVKGKRDGNDIVFDFFAEWHLERWNSREKDDIDYYLAKNPEKIQTDDLGDYVVKTGIVIDRAFFDQAACMRAFAEGHEPSANGQQAVEDMDEVPF
jgi:hypothetical protein